MLLWSESDHQCKSNTQVTVQCLSRHYIAAAMGQSKHAPYPRLWQGRAFQSQTQSKGGIGVPGRSGRQEKRLQKSREIGEPSSSYGCCLHLLPPPLPTQFQDKGLPPTSKWVGNRILESSKYSNSKMSKPKR